MSASLPDVINAFAGKFRQPKGQDFYSYEGRSPSEKDFPREIWDPYNNPQLNPVNNSLSAAQSLSSKLFACGTTKDGSPYLGTILGSSHFDNAGRVFNVTHYQLRPNPHDRTSTFESLINYSCPVDKTDPVEMQAVKPFHPIYDEQTKKLFGVMCDSIRNQKPICIIDEAIDTDTIPIPQTMDNWTFQDFPGGVRFLSALKLIPPDLQRQIPFLFNADADVLRKTKKELPFRVAYGGSEVIVNKEFHKEFAKLNVGRIQGDGYEVVTLGQYQTSSADTELYNRLAGKDSPANGDAHFSSLYSAADAKAVTQKAAEEAEAALRLQQQEAFLQRQQQDSKKSGGGFFGKFFRDPDMQTGRGR